MRGEQALPPQASCGCQSACLIVSYRDIRPIIVHRHDPRWRGRILKSSPSKNHDGRPLLMGTDWTRAFTVVNYEQGVEPFLKTDRLSDPERAVLMGGACAK